MFNLTAAIIGLCALALPHGLPDGPQHNLRLEAPKTLIAAGRLPEFLTSGSNDLIVLRQQRAGTSRPDIVKVCLANRSRSGGRKAFDNHRTKKPRFVVDAGADSCGQVHPTRQDFIFWKAGPSGILKPVLKQKLDLSGHAGYIIRFEWIDD